MARPPSETSRRAVLDAAADLLDAHGADRLTLAAIIERSGVAKTTVYRQFGSLDGVVFTLIAERVQHDPPPDTGTLRGDLAAVQRTYLARFDDPLGRELFVWMLQHAVASPDGAELFNQARFGSDGPTATVLRRAIEHGELPADTDVNMALHLMQGAMISKRVISNDVFTADDFDCLIEMSLRALNAPQEPEQ